MTVGLAQRAAVAPAHHPRIETLAEYAAGQMRAGFDLVIAAHLAGCARCRAELAELETLGGALLQDIAPVPLDDRAFDAMLARLDAPAPSQHPARGLEQLLAGAKRRWIAPGIWIASIDTPHEPDDRVFLLRVAAGATTAHHHHSGAEMMQVLTGALNDNGVIYRAGDMGEIGESDAHHPQVHGDEPCICLFATQGRLRPTTLIGRIAFALAGV